MFISRLQNKHEYFNLLINIIDAVVHPMTIMMSKVVGMLNQLLIDDLVCSPASDSFLFSRCSFVFLGKK